MVTACAIIVSGLLSHYAAINDRIRALTREHLDLLRAQSSDELTHERMDEIEAQLPDLLHRHKLMRDTVLATYCAMFTFIANMFVIALAAALSSEWITNAALIVFWLGTGLLLLGVLLTARYAKSPPRIAPCKPKRRAC